MVLQLWSYNPVSERRRSHRRLSTALMAPESGTRIYCNLREIHQTISGGTQDAIEDATLSLKTDENRQSRDQFCLQPVHKYLRQFCEFMTLYAVTAQKAGAERFSVYCQHWTHGIYFGLLISCIFCLFKDDRRVTLASSPRSLQPLRAVLGHGRSSRTEHFSQKYWSLLTQDFLLRGTYKFWTVCIVYRVMGRVRAESR